MAVLEPRRPGLASMFGVRQLLTPEPGFIIGSVFGAVMIGANVVSSLVADGDCDAGQFLPLLPKDCTRIPANQAVEFVWSQMPQASL